MSENNPPSGGVVGEALRMNNQAQFAKRRKRLGPVDMVLDQSIQGRFERFHFENPSVYFGLVTLARRLLAKGHTCYGIVSLFEVLRYDGSLETNGKPFKLSNNFRSRYARLIMDREPDLKGFFRTRELTAL